MKTGLFVLWSILIMSVSLAENKNLNLERLTQIRKEGNGILTEADIADENGSAYRESNYLSYWTCFDSKNVIMKCIDMGFTHDGHMSDLNLEASREGEIHDYGYRRLIGLSICREQRRRWNTLQKKQSRVCIEGNEAGVENKTYQKKKPIKVYSWVWNRTKTASGCISHWEHCEGP